jgi:hypothetical protein
MFGFMTGAPHGWAGQSGAIRPVRNTLPHKNLSMTNRYVIRTEDSREQAESATSVDGLNA